MMKNRVLVLTSTYPLPSDDRQPSFIRSLCREVAKKHELYVLAPAIRGRCDGEQERNLEVVRYRYFYSKFESLCGGDGMLENLKQNKWLYFSLPFLLFAQLVTAFHSIRSKDINVIHSHWILPQGLVMWCLSLVFRRRLRYILTAHGGDLFALQGRVMTFIKKRILNSADQVTVVSHAMRDYCIDKLEVDIRKVKVQAMGVDLVNTFTPPVEARTNSIPYLIYVGRLAEKKGVEVLLNAVSGLHLKGITFHLDIIGGGRQLDQYKQLANQLGIETLITFHGFVPNHEVVRYLRQADIAVFPFKVAKDGDQEGLGLTMVEAMGCGCLTIASDLPAVRDVISHMETGLLVESNAPEKLTGILETVVGRRPVYKDIAERGRQYVLSAFDWSAVGQFYSKILSDD